MPDIQIPKIDSQMLKIDIQAAAAKRFLDGKLDEILATTNTAGLGVALVTDAGERLISSARGQRKLGASGTANTVQPNDRWCQGSVSKPITGSVVGLMIAKGVGGITWKTTIADVFPEIFLFPGAKPFYRDVPLEWLMAHASGLRYNPISEPGDQWFPDPWFFGVNDANLMERRYKFVQAAVLDEPIYSPGAPASYTGDPSVGPYGGGPIICAAMYERRTGTRFEYLLRDHLFLPLGMTHSSWGVTSPGALDGPWQHEWSESQSRLVPNESTHSPPYNFSSHGVAGYYALSAADLGRFIAENLTASPTVISAAIRKTVLHRRPAWPHSFTSGGWSASGKDPAKSDSVAHEGDNGTSYASMVIDIAGGWGAAACSNVNNRFGVPAIRDAQEAMQTLRQRWTEIAGSGLPTYPASVHPTPAITAKAGAIDWVFGRRHTGALSRERIGQPAGGAPQEFAGGVFTSGIAAAASADGKLLLVAGRGTDDQIWFARSSERGTSWQAFFPIPNGTFRTGPALACDATGKVVHVAAVGMDNRMYHARTLNHGESWSAWTAIDAGIFTSQPALTCSSDAKIVHAFGRGADNRIWHNVSIHSGTGWRGNWTGLGKGIFTSGPAAVCGANGGQLLVAGRGTDRRIWTLRSTGTDGPWDAHWRAIENGTFSSGPALARAGTTTVVAAFGGDHMPYRSISGNGGDSWGNWASVGGAFFV